MPAPGFLDEINPWRESMARDLLPAGAPASPPELQQKVDRTLLNHLFLRIARARGIQTSEFGPDPSPQDAIPEAGDLATLPPDILGQVYEHCLAHPIRLDEDGRPSVEKHASARKSTGVFYTPPEIVDYIIHQTLCRLLQGAPAFPGPANPATAGEDGMAGTFPLKILDPSCGSGSFLIAAYQHLLDWHLAQSGTSNLISAERIRILLDHIHGIDIDPQAVELTKLSLILLALEPGSSGPLPDLDRNIRCGDALTIDWTAAFPAAFARGGFDCIIGNPPYLFGEHLDPAEKESLKERFPSAADQADAYQFFLELTGRLANRSATTGMLVPDAILARSGCSAVRRLLLENGLERVFHCGSVFGAGVSTAALIQSAGHTGPVARDDLDDGRIRTRHHCRRSRFETDPEHRLLIHASDREHELLEKIGDSSIPLGDLGTLSRGEELGRRHLSSHDAIPILVGRDVSSYRIAPPTRFVAILRKPAEIYQPGKILIVKTGTSPVAAIDTEGHATLQSLYNFHPHPDAPDPRYLLAIINSRLIAWWIKKTFTAYKKLFPQLNQETTAGIPIRPPGESDGPVYQNILACVDEISAPSHQDPATDRRIDRLVYQIYRLSDEDVAVLNGGSE